MNILRVCYDLYHDFVFSLGNTLWLDPFVKQEKLKQIKEDITTFNVRQDLIREEMALPNEQVPRKL